MVKYYVKITQQQPTDEDDSVWFELESGSDEKGEFFALRRNEYDNLVNQFHTIEQKFEEEYVQPIVNDKVDAYLDGKDSVSNSTNAKNLINPNDPTQKHTWASISSNLTTLNNSFNTLSNNVSTALENKVDVNTVTSLQSTVNSKAPSNHTHTGWTFVRFNDYCTGYYNSAIRIMVMRYYRSDYNFSKTSAFKLHSGLFKNYKPLVGGDFILNMYNAEMGGYVDDANGDMYVYSRNTGKKTISTSAMWRY